ncbi:MAG: helix-hairpin-helix domain-containing protein [Candidatus Zapsychrus exili]|nr:helix-hairpin-helix domain-containing protein [Candidatus Zapsychrus exili]
MLNFTKQERVVLVLLVTIALCGSIFNYVFKRYPELKDIVNFADSSDIYPKVDINTASVEDFVVIPYIGEYTAKNIVEYRRRYGIFNSIEQLKQVRGIREKNYNIFSKYLRIKQ